MNFLRDFFEKHFHLSNKNTNIKTEIIAGSTTFMAMVYILVVNAGMISETGEVSFDSVYIATALSAVLGTLILAFISNLPLAMASGMGLNAYFVYTICIGYGFSYSNALMIILFNGIILLILTITGIRQKMFEAIPKCVRQSIPAGIGLFIAFLGLKDSGIITSDDSTLLKMASFDIIRGKVNFSFIAPKLITFITLVIIVVLTVKGVKGAVFFGILSGTILYYISGIITPGFFNDFITSIHIKPLKSFNLFFHEGFFRVFTEGFDFGNYLKSHSKSDLIITLITSELSFCMVDIFDTMGTLYGACLKGNLLTKDGKVPKFKQAMLSDSIATILGSLFGTSTITAFAESSTGIACGGKTGLTAFTTSIWFFLALFFTPFAKLIPSCAMAASLIYVGILMISSIKNINWDNINDAFPAFFTIIMMPFTANISYGVAFGFFAVILMRLLSGKIKEIRLSTFIVGLLFLLLFFVS